jgi:cell division protein FtsB
MLVPVICCAVSLYFGYSGIFGERGLIAWNNSESQLANAKRELNEVRTKREALQHRIALMDDKHIDADLLEEVARDVLLENRPDVVAVPREKR